MIWMFTVRSGERGFSRKTVLKRCRRERALFLSYLIQESEMAKKKETDSADLKTIRGIGEKTEKLFRQAGVYTTEDLLHYYPRDYDAYDEPVRAGETVAGVKNAVFGKITAKPSVRTFGKNSITIVKLTDETGTLYVHWFHMPFLRNTLTVGKHYVFRGLVTEKNGRKTMEHPELFDPEKYEKIRGQLLPVYALTSGLSNNTVRKAVASLLEMTGSLPEYLPDEIREMNGLCEINFAISQIHFPDSRDNLITARNRLAFDEFFLFLLGVAEMKTQQEKQDCSWPMKTGWKTEEVLDHLPYRLTPAQDRVWGEMERDLASGKLMNRLIQGDVGSGKTILAFLAMIMTFENGFQSAMMVPTEVLAEQQYHSLVRLLEENQITGVNPVLLRGSCTAAEKRRIDEEISSGKARMIVGTHALIQDTVSFRNLALAVTDEQHRFGVRQREKLSEKGAAPHVLVMSATPIPRTLALILYGDLDISVLDDMPADRLQVKNCVVGPSYRKTAWNFIAGEVKKGRQAYVICPMVEPNEELPCENVTDYTAELKKYYGGTVNVGMLHGRMKPKEKNQIMEDFASGDIQVLVSTTVVEVGVNVPNATVMLIENAERFGLAQLHQLRGRVGRGKEQSYCIFMQGDGRQETSKRLSVLSETNDGFRIAEEDLKMRGPGDLFGVRQSGEAVFQIADIYRDHEVLTMAEEAVKNLKESDPDLTLPQNSGLRDRVSALFQRQIDHSQSDI
jgi:ATP-dependent DNA helicase RecG